MVKDVARDTEEADEFLPRYQSIKSSMSYETRVLIVARSSALRAGLRSLLEAEFEIVAESSSLAKLELSNIDVIVFDGETSSLETSFQLPSIVYLSDQPNAANDLLELNLPNWAIVASDASETELRAAVQATAQGFSVMTPNILEQLLTHNPEPKFSLEQDLPTEALTPRELEVLAALSHGLSNKQIAKQLGISGSTVKFHVAQVYAKLGVSSRVSAVNLGIRYGFISI